MGWFSGNRVTLWFIGNRVAQKRKGWLSGNRMAQRKQGIRGNRVTGWLSGKGSLSGNRVAQRKQGGTEETGCLSGNKGGSTETVWHRGNRVP